MQTSHGCGEEEVDRGEEELECEQEVEQLDLAWLVSAATARCCATLLLLHVMAHQHAPTRWDQARRSSGFMWAEKWREQRYTAGHSG